MTSYRRSPRRASLALERMRHDWAPDTLLANVQRVWADAVGAAIASEAEPTAERGGVLTISCSASVWAQELDLMGPVLVERLNGLLEGQRVGRLRCVAVPGPEAFQGRFRAP
jgi:predicted nucleic acid-binding Zn ribbon protein